MNAPKQFLETSSDQTWRNCIVCGKDELLQVRKAKWTCNFCNQEYIADEKDMRPEGYNEH
jgi:hypothetical protein